MSGNKKEKINNNPQNDAINIKEIIIKLDTIFEEKLNLAFHEIMIIPRKRFLNNIISAVKKLIEDQYGNSIYKNTRFNNIFTSCLNNLEDRCNNYTEELTNTWEKYQNSKKMGGEDSFFLTNFRKHCIKTEDLALHKCQDGKFGNFIIVTKKIKNNSVNKRNKESQMTHIQYIICNKCKTTYFSNKFINYCKYCNINYLCSIMSYSEDPNLLLATWNPPHCETLANEKIRCLKCNDNFLYLNMKTNMLQCHNRICNFSTFANSAESICNICNKTFRSNCKIYNPVEVMQIKEVIKITLLIKKKARPNYIPCCGNVDNINSYDFYHKKECKGLLFLGTLNNKNIVVCEKCKAINNFNKFFWTCPLCENKFKENGLSKSVHDTKNEKNETKNKVKDMIIFKAYSINNSLNSSKNDIKNINKENNNNKNDDNNKIEKEENNNINNLNYKNTLYYMMEAQKNINPNNKTNNIFDYRANYNGNGISNKSPTPKKNKNDTDIINIDNVGNIKKKYSHSKYLAKQRDINDIGTIKEELETRYISKKFFTRSINKDPKNEQNNNDKNISPISNNNNKLNDNDKKNDEKIENNTDNNPQNHVRLITRRSNLYNNQTHNIKGIYSQKVIKLDNENDNNTNLIKRSFKDFNESKTDQNYIKSRNRYSKKTININERDREKHNKKIIELNLNSYSLSSNNEIVPPISSKYLFYKNKKNFQSQDNTFNENDHEKLLSQSINTNCKDNENISIKKSKKNSIPISTKNYKSKKINYDNNTQENDKSKTRTDSSTNINSKYLNESEKKLKSFFVSPDNFKKEEEKNECTMSFHLRDKYKKKHRSDSKNDSKENSSKNSKENIEKIEKIEKNKHVIKNLFKDKKTDQNSITLNNSKEIINNNFGLTIDQKMGFHRKQLNQKKTEDPSSNLIKKFTNGNNQYYTNRHLHTSTNSNPDNEDFNNDLNIVKKKENISPSPHHNKKIRYEYKRVRKKINTIGPTYSNELNENNNEDNDKKNRIELLNEINKEFKSNKFKRKNSINENNKNKLSMIETSDKNKTKIIIFDNDINKKKRMSEKLEKSLKILISKSKLPNFEIKEYVIRKQIGEGTFGVIYEVYNKKTLTKYAIKKIIASNLETISEFQKEFELIYENPHKNILDIFGMCIEYMDENNFAIYVLMELAEEDWDSLINKRFNNNLFYSESQLISILKQLTSALCYLQKEKNIAHRDIKPENILVFKREVYKLSDFGEAKESKLSKQYSTLRGTELYMSPLLYTSFHEEKENVKHNPYKSDVFSLGYCLIYASSLNFNIIYEIRNVSNTFLLKRILTRHLSTRYSTKFIDILLKMITFSEDDRMDFIELDKILREEY